jgi:tRNA-dihydrouridine synthase A
LRHALVHRLKADFPALTIVLNGGIGSDEEIAAQLPHVDGVMVGRHAYHEPWAMAGWDQRFLGATAPAASSRDEVEARFVEHLARLPWPADGSRMAATRHMMGLRNGEPGARRWRQVWSDAQLRQRPLPEVMQLARAAMRQQIERVAA